MAICEKCGKTISDEADICIYCKTPQEARFVRREANKTVMGLEKTKTMFDKCANEPAPTCIEDCVSPDKVTDNLWQWASRLEIIGKVLFYLIIIAGIAISLSNAMVTHEVIGNYTTETVTKFQFKVLLSNLLTYGIYAIAEYCLYHVVALLVGSMARIVQSNRTLARLAELEAISKHDNQ